MRAPALCCVCASDNGPKEREREPACHYPCQEANGDKKVRERSRRIRRERERERRRRRGQTNGEISPGTTAMTNRTYQVEGEFAQKKRVKNLQTLELYYERTNLRRDRTGQHFCREAPNLEIFMTSASCFLLGFKKDACLSQLEISFFTCVCKSNKTSFPISPNAQSLTALFS